LTDNVTLPGTGVVIASDDIGAGLEVQRVKAGWGADGVYNDPQVSQPLPVQATVESSQMSNQGTLITPLFASINVSSSGDNTIVAAVSGKVTRVLSYSLVCDAANAVKWTSGAAGTALTGAMSFSANGGISTPFSPVGHFQTGTNTALVLNLGSAVGVRGHLTYVNL